MWEITSRGLRLFCSSLSIKQQVLLIAESDEWKVEKPAMTAFLPPPPPPTLVTFLRVDPLGVHSLRYLDVPECHNWEVNKYQNSRFIYTSENNCIRSRETREFFVSKERTPALNETPSDSMANISWMGKVRDPGDEGHSMAAILCSI